MVIGLQFDLAGELSAACMWKDGNYDGYIDLVLCGEWEDFGTWVEDYNPEMDDTNVSCQFAVDADGELVGMKYRKGYRKGKRHYDCQEKIEQCKTIAAAFNKFTDLEHVKTYFKSPLGVSA